MFSNNTKKALFRANKSLDRTMSIDASLSDLPRVGQTSLDSESHRHLWASYYKSRSSAPNMFGAYDTPYACTTDDVSCPEEDQAIEEDLDLSPSDVGHAGNSLMEPCRYRPYLILARITRRSWPSSRSWYVCLLIGLLEMSWYSAFLIDCIVYASSIPCENIFLCKSL